MRSYDYYVDYDQSLPVTNKFVLSKKSFTLKEVEREIYKQGGVPLLNGSTTVEEYLRKLVDNALLSLDGNKYTATDKLLLQAANKKVADTPFLNLTRLFSKKPKKLNILFKNLDLKKRP